MFEVAVSAQDAVRVKMVSFEYTLGYLHNGLYRDPRLPDIIKWARILLVKVKALCDSVLIVHHCYVFFIMSSLQEVCPVAVTGKMTEPGKNIWYAEHWFILFTFHSNCLSSQCILHKSDVCDFNLYSWFLCIQNLVISLTTIMFMAM